MARTTLVAQQPNSAGLVPSFSAANADGHAFPADRHTIFEVVNGSGVSINVTFPTPGTVDSGALPDKVVAVAAGARKLFNFANALSLYKQSDGLLYVDFSAVTSITVAVLQT